MYNQIVGTFARGQATDPQYGFCGSLTAVKIGTFAEGQRMLTPGEKIARLR
jgi:hypothetical protein